MPALAAAVLLSVGAGLGTWYTTYLNPTYATDIGEQRSIPLEDGSSVQLNSQSRIRVRFSEHERTVELLRGQALFRVAKNPDRPFVVESGATSVRAVGTEFDVYKKRTGTVVTVVKGRVAVADKVVLPMAAPHSVAEDQGKSSSSALLRPKASKYSRLPGGDAAGDVSPSAVGEVLLSAGEQLTLSTTAVTRPKRTNVALATAWTQRRLIFNSQPLTEVAEEFNRYNTRVLVIQSPELRSFNISGVYSSTDPTSLVRFLKTQPGIIVEEDSSQVVISQR